VINTVAAKGVIIACAMSGLPQQADIISAAGYVRKVPTTDMIRLSPMKNCPGVTNSCEPTAARTAAGLLWQSLGQCITSPPLGDSVAPT
jgi:hypothetical protein